MDLHVTTRKSMHQLTLHIELVFTVKLMAKASSTVNPGFRIQEVFNSVIAVLCVCVHIWKVSVSDDGDSLSPSFVCDRGRNC